MRTRAVFAGLLAVAGVLGEREATAEFKVCNQTLGLYNIAIGIVKDDGPHTEGWWTVAANDCVSPISDDLTDRFIYVLAINIYGDDAFRGDKEMCIDRHAHFQITGADDCWLSGKEPAKFKEIDTHSASSWTVFIREGQN
jgi:uncharacterized membrane protein